MREREGAFKILFTSEIGGFAARPFFAVVYEAGAVPALPFHFYFRFRPWTSDSFPVQMGLACVGFAGVNWELLGFFKLVV